MTVYATGYCLKGTTATGLPVGPGIVAVDPSVIPLGTRMTIPGYGEGVAADTGGAIQGAADRRLVPERARRRGLGPPHGHDHVPLGPRLRLRRVRSRRGDVSDAVNEEARRDDVRVVLVDDHDLFRTGLRNLLEEQGVDVRRRGGERRRGGAARARARARRRRHGPEHAGDERRRGDAADHRPVAPLTRVIVLTISDQDADVMDAIVAGACGYLLKDSSIDERRSPASASAAVGESLISPHDRGEGAAARARDDAPTPTWPRRSAPSSPTASSRC